MKATLSITLPSGMSSHAVLASLGGHEEKTPRATVRRAINKGMLDIEIIASDFSALRAMTSSTLRDMKVVLDAQRIAAGKKNVR